MGSMHVVKETTHAVEKKPVAITLSCFGSISLQTRIKRKK